MKQILTLLLSIIITLPFTIQAQKTNFFSFKVKTINGDSIDLSTYAGKKILVVNTASYCGYTPQYADLQQLYTTYKDKNFVIIAFPANDFANQEPGSDGQILEFCQTNYNITFPIMSKIHVTGTEIHPLYKWLTQKSQNGLKDAPVSWNFQKFMINPDGSLYDFVPPSGSPLAPKITQWIEKTSSVNEVLQKHVFVVYPSPAKQKFTIVVNVEKNSKVTLRIYDSKGVLAEELYNDMLESELRIEYFTDRLQNGNYIVTTEIDGFKQSQQITIKKD